MISNLGMSSAMELKFEHADTTGLAFNQRALMFGKSTIYLAMSLGFVTLLSIKFSCSKLYGQSKLASDSIPSPSRSKTMPPASNYC